ncbi:P-loop containing nucleoside triphosphate hydrolase protein [Fimicolochytrium jonesii]|uniref:P-loop containing nucleoside triphosphate hydrolase protein n=1 Tax=Fimicolochytrium jonesii TaxID=1396493 RepID=UPI0022FEF9C0|nr:P-loop containing nucleoside triphosphate hydrolase protein [Fimicolochytrium jonesii]KAI8817791.1 P-loop containing nucleoside triphosphate hydrolase protein [Fimicolochytrium jonesii]
MKLNPTSKKVLVDVSIFALSQVVLYFGVKWVLAGMDPFKKKKEEAKAKSTRVLGRLGLQVLKLTEHEEIIAAEVVYPEDIPVGFKDIGGLDHIVKSLKESVIYPLCYPQLFSSASGLLGAPKGVLLYGPPGCGKTMLAKALAKESGATFINLHVSTLMEKWFGESQKLVSAVFSLAHKLQPCIIFIDEIDSFLRERKSQDHEVTAMMKAEFMTLWDGLSTGDMRVLVLGATNRPTDIDQAILRRMPKRFEIRLPDAEQRTRVLSLLLAGADLEPGFDVKELVYRTAGYSGSDLKELCRNAAMMPIREAIRELDGHLLHEFDASDMKVRQLRVSDFFVPHDQTLGDEDTSAEVVDLD